MKLLFQNWTSKVISLAIAILLIIISRSVSTEVRFFDLSLNVLLHETMIPGETYPKVVRLGLKGDPELIKSVKAWEFKAVLDLTQYNIEGRFYAPVEIQRSGTALKIDPLEISVNPKDMYLTIEYKMKKLVEVKPRTKGFPPLGYKLVSSQVVPEQIPIEGPRSRVSLISSVPTEDIDLSNKRISFSQKVKIAHDDSLIQFPAGDIVEYRVAIEETMVLNSFSPVDILVIDLVENLTVVSPLPSGSVQVQGKVNLLDTITASDLQLIIDASAIKHPGIYEITPHPQGPPGVIILQFTPKKVKLKVEARAR